jgi:hypothetical protein
VGRFTFKLLCSTASSEEVVKMGEIDKEGALHFVKAFPFKRELRKREQDPTLVVPTLTFHDNAAHRYLHVSSDTPGRYTVWKPDAEVRADGVRSMLKVLACLSLFFDGKDRELNEFIAHLSGDRTRPGL